MGYRELLEALGTEVREQAREMHAAAEVEASRLLQAARREAEARRTTALAETGSAIDAERDAVLEPALRDAEDSRLRAKRVALDHLHAAAEEALAGLDSPAILERLLEDVLAEIGGHAEVRVNPALVPAVRESLAMRGLEDRVSVDADPSIAGAGVVAICANGNRRLDDSLPSRLRVAWAALEGEIAARLFGERTATMGVHEGASAGGAP